MLIGTVDEPPTREAADAFLLRWTSGLPTRLDWFAREVTWLGGPALTYETDQCVPVLALVVEHIGDDGAVDPVPEWYRDVHRRHGWSPYGAGLVEGLMASSPRCTADRGCGPTECSTPTLATPTTCSPPCSRSSRRRPASNPADAGG